MKCLFLLINIVVLYFKYEENKSNITNGLIYKKIQLTRNKYYQRQTTELEASDFGQAHTGSVGLDMFVSNPSFPDMHRAVV